MQALGRPPPAWYGSPVQAADAVVVGKLRNGSWTRHTVLSLVRFMPQGSRF